MASKDLQPNKATMGKLFLQSQFCTKPKPPPESTSLAGQTALITGSNIGIGLECARQFLQLDVEHLILGVRTVEKGEQAAVNLRKSHPKTRIEVWPLDMLSYKSIENFTKRCQGLERLDVAILNAGITSANFVLNQSTGHEEMVQVNYLSTALLSILLLPVLSKRQRSQSNPGRLTVVSSGTALIAQFPNHADKPLIASFDDGTGWDLNAATDRYCNSKVLLLMFVSKISELVDPKKVIINVVDPGFVQGTGLHRNLGGGLQAMFAIMKALTARSLKQGAWAYVDAAVVTGKETHGCFMMDYKISPYHAMMYTDEGRKTSERLWEETLEEFQSVRAKEIIASVA